ncbi:MAG: hypothetical protein ACXWE0_09255 [Nitrososphaeraceae archaeon]
MEGNHLIKYNKCNIETLLDKALSAALMDLDPLKNSHYNRHLILEIEILQWMIDIIQKIGHNLTFLKELVKHEIDNFKVRYNFVKNIDEIDKVSNSIEILQTCLFLINIEYEFQHLPPLVAKDKII